MGASMLRFMFAFLVVIGSAYLAIVYSRVWKPIYDMLTGDYSGPFTSAVAGPVDTTLPLIAGVLLLFAFVWLIASEVQSERARDVIRRGPPR